MCYPVSVAKWCTVTVTDPDGRRHSLDLQAASTFDAAHLYVTEAKKDRAVGFPKLTLATVFEVITEGKIYRVKGEALQRVDCGAPAEVAGTEGVHVHEAARACLMPAGQERDGRARRYRSASAYNAMACFTASTTSIGLNGLATSTHLGEYAHFSHWGS